MDQNGVHRPCTKTREHLKRNLPNVLEDHRRIYALYVRASLSVSSRLWLPKLLDLTISGPLAVITTGLISQANGSAYIETERLKIACAVYALHEQCVHAQSLNCWFRYGPRQNKNQPYNEKGKLNVEVKFAPFASARRRAPMRVCGLFFFFFLSQYMLN
jgi:3' exoribonuclease family, domain 1